MAELKPVLAKARIEEIVNTIARQISADYQGRELILIGVLKGAFIFLADLIRRLTIPVKVDFIGASSYGCATTSSGTIRVTKQVELDLEGKEVLLVEDIVDTGLTLKYLIEYLQSQGAHSVKVCALLDKRERRSEAVPIQYSGQTVGEGFLVGYGLDYAENYRNLEDICHLER